jgi:maltooligosyltrehalose trehalohydrolase
MTVAHQKRRLTCGVELQAEGGAHARVWAPDCRSVELVLLQTERGGGRAERVLPLDREPDGYFSGVIDAAAPGDCYWYQLDGERRRPDPFSRFQPSGPHGPSAIVDPSAFRWTDEGWKGLSAAGQVLYELHVGTFTPDGTWSAAAGRLPHLRDLGVTTIEMMPIAEFAGRWGWGYDGVDLYAPTHLYGEPDDLRRFLDRAHAIGIGVILDVVYNHLGPSGNYLSEYSRDYFTKKYNNDWGESLNFEGPRAARELFVQNAAYWIDEYHFDGLRLDATQDIHDASPEHVVAELTRAARAAAGARRVFIVAENEPQDARLVRDPSHGGYGVDAFLDDDYHHCAVVALTGHREAYYSDYTGAPQEFVSSVKYGFLYQGQYYSWQKKNRGTAALDLPHTAFVRFLENHDQVANSAHGKRLHQLASPGRYRALTALTLLGPATPLLFQGQEFASSVPFLFFADHDDDLRAAIRAGRREFLAQFPSIRDGQVSLAEPDDPQTYEGCKLDWSEAGTNAAALALHHDLLEIRRQDPVVAAAATASRIDGAVLTPHSFVLRYDPGARDDRLLLVNLGTDADLTPIREPLLAPPAAARWTVQWSSDDVKYGGTGAASLRTEPAWRLKAESAVLLRPEPRS